MWVKKIFYCKEGILSVSAYKGKYTFKNNIPCEIGVGFYSKIILYNMAIVNLNRNKSDRNAIDITIYDNDISYFIFLHSFALGIKPWHEKPFIHTNNRHNKHSHSKKLFGDETNNFRVSESNPRHTTQRKAARGPS